MQKGFGDVGGDGVVSIGTATWNIADGYTKIKILRILIEIDLYETIAIFGMKDLDENVPNELIPYRRVTALKRVLFCLKQLVGNCKFTIDKVPLDETLLKNYLERLNTVENYISYIADEKINHVTKERILFINENHFQICFNILRQIKDEVNSLLDRAGIIFRKGDSLDMDAMMKEIEDGGM